MAESRQADPLRIADEPRSLTGHATPPHSLSQPPPARKPSAQSKLGATPIRRADNPSRRIPAAAPQTLQGAQHRAPSLRPESHPRLGGDRAGFENGHRRAGDVNHRRCLPPVLGCESYRPRRPHILRAGVRSDRFPHRPRHGRIVAVTPSNTGDKGRPLPPQNRPHSVDRRVGSGPSASLPRGESAAERPSLPPQPRTYHHPLPGEHFSPRTPSRSTQAHVRGTTRGIPVGADLHNSRGVRRPRAPAARSQRPDAPRAPA
jgi:hypothetical protein